MPSGKHFSTSLIECLNSWLKTIAISATDRLKLCQTSYEEEQSNPKHRGLSTSGSKMEEWARLKKKILQMLHVWRKTNATEPADSM